MESKKERTQSQYLTEEHYNKVNKKIKIISLVILILGLAIGGGLIAAGLIKTAEAKKTNEERAAAALAESQAAAAAAKERLSEIETEKASLESEYNKKQQECDSLDMKASDWFAKSSQCNRESSSISSKISNLEMEQFKLEHGDYNVRYNLEPLEKFIPLYVLGAFIAGAGVMTSLAVFLITKRRALRAYGIQSTMPVNKEAAEQYASTAAKAAGDIASSVAEGIARGTKGGKKS